ncbi:hypothetical protein Hte_003664 [Hypoxylon texense]
MDYAVPTTEHRFFVPSEQLTGRSNRARNANPAAGNYRGDPNLQANIGSHCPEHLNTSLWLTNLPTKDLRQRLLDHIAAFKVGRVRSTVINDPTETSITAAATISFFRRQDAEFLYRLIRNQQMVIEGMCPRVQWNRNKVKEGLDGNESRVLLIAGYSYFVNAKMLRAFFGTKFSYEEDIVIDHGEVPTDGDPIARVEFRFGSWRCQAQWGMKTLKMEMKGLVQVEYGLDPCAV